MWQLNISMIQSKVAVPNKHNAGEDGQTNDYEDAKNVPASLEEGQHIMDYTTYLRVKCAAITLVAIDWKLRYLNYYAAKINK